MGKKLTQSYETCAEDGRLNFKKGILIPSAN